MDEELYLGKKVSELNISEQRFRKLMFLMRVKRILDKSMEVKCKYPKIDYTGKSSGTFRY